MKILLFHYFAMIIVNFSCIRNLQVRYDLHNLQHQHLPRILAPGLPASRWWSKEVRHQKIHQHQELSWLQDEWRQESPVPESWSKAAEESCEVQWYFYNIIGVNYEVSAVTNIIVASCDHLVTSLMLSGHSADKNSIRFSRKMRKIHPTIMIVVPLTSNTYSNKIFKTFMFFYENICNIIVTEIVKRILNMYLL